MVSNMIGMNNAERKIAQDLAAYMCVHDGVKDVLLGLAVQSVLRQTLLPSKFVFAIDGPISQSKNQIIMEFEAKFADLKVNCSKVSAEENIGHGAIRALALDTIDTTYVATCDSDDISAADRFERLLNVLRNNSSIAVVGCHIIEKDLLDQHSPSYRKRVPITSHQVRAELGARCPINQMTTILSVEALVAVGGYEEFYHNEDYYLWFKLLNAGFRLCNVDDYLVVAHSDDDSIGRRGGIKYFLSELRMQRLLYRYRYKSLIGLFFSIFIRCVVQVLLSKRVRQLFYKKFLREEVFDG